MTEETRRLQRAIDRWAAGRRGLRVLEAGCGAKAHVQIGTDPYIVGIDISGPQLDRHTGLAEKIQADVQSYPLPSGSYDAVVCWDVLEHLPSPDRALHNFAQALRPGGIIVLAIPNLLSVKGLVTKFTPHSAHVWFYRDFMGYKDAGKNDTAPFPTKMRGAIAPSALRRFARAQGLDVVYLRRYESGVQTAARDKLRLHGPAWSAVKALVSIATLGAVSAQNTDCLVVLRRPEVSTPVVEQAAA